MLQFDCIDIEVKIESGSKAYLGEDLPGEYTHSKYTEQLYSRRRDLYSIKMQAAQNLGELIEIATNRRWERAKHQHNKDAKYGIYKYDSRIAFPAGQKVKAYTVELLILNANDGKKYLYDVQNIKKNTAVASALYFKGRGRSMEASPRTSGVLTDNVPQTAESVNSENQYARRDEPSTADARRIVGRLQITDRMNDTEKDMLTRYQSHLTEMEKLIEQINEQKRIIDSDEATEDEKMAARAIPHTVRR